MNEILIVLGIILGLVLTGVLNRWRGTGDLFKIGKLRVTGVMVYALYLAMVIGVLSTWYYGIVVAMLFVAGESFAWGKWIGYLVSDNGEKEYWNDNGKSFPYIHQMADFIVKEKDNYLWYCRTALAIRGFIWWTPLYLLLAGIGVISVAEALISGIILGISFPLACWLGKRLTFAYKSKWLVVETPWERQEVVYGVLQGLVLTLSLYLGLGG